MLISAKHRSATQESRLERVRRSPYAAKVLEKSEFRYYTVLRGTMQQYVRSSNPEGVELLGLGTGKDTGRDGVTP